MPWNGFLADVRVSLRGLVRAPLFSAVAFAVLALALGANAAIFNLLNTVLLRPIRAAAPERLAAVYTLSAEGQPGGLSYTAYEAIRREQRAFSGLFAWSSAGIYTVEVNGSLAPASVVVVTPGYFQVLGVPPLIGRTFHEGLDDGAQAAVISYRCWQTRFGGRADITGQTVRVDGHPYTVIGVMPEDFRGYTIGVNEDITIALPAWFDAQRLRSPSGASMEILGRLRDGVSLSQAEQQLMALWPSIRAAAMPAGLSEAEQRAYLGRKLTVAEGRSGGSRDFLRRRYRRPLLILMGAVSITLLVACANLAGLLISRAAARRQNTAVRMALGAGRWRLLRQAFAEALLLLLPAVAAGAAFGIWISRMLADFMWTGLLPHELNLSPDWRVYACLALLATGIAIAASTAPVLQVSQQASASLITGVTRGSAGTRQSAGKWLVSGQSALALVLLTAAALFGTSFRNLRASDLGFETERVLGVQLTNRPEDAAAEEARPEYYRQLLAEVARIPGVRAASLSKLTPVIPPPFDVRESVAVPGGAARARAYRHDVAPGFFETFGIPILRGRGMAFTDDENTPKVAVVSASLANQLFPSGDAIGQRISVGNSRDWQNVQIIGIAADASLWNIRRRRPPLVYLAYFQQPERMHSPMLEVRTSGPAESVARDVTRVLDLLGREYAIRTLPISGLVDISLVQDRLMALLALFFGVFPVILAAVGLYGLVAYNVSRRTAEMGVRMALGAARADLMRMVIREALAMVALGVVAGIPLALAAARLARGLLYEVSPANPFVLAAACLTLFAAGAIASMAPAWRATRIQPIAALRAE